MSRDSRALHTYSPSDRLNGHEQFPVDIKVAHNVIFDVDGRDFIKIVVMSDLRTRKYFAFHEYHWMNWEINLDSIDSFVLRSGTINSTDEAIDEFLGPRSIPIKIPQVVAFQRGVHEPSAAHRRLYQATDPDDTTKMIGCLIEQDQRGQFVQITWYKTSETNAIFQSVPRSLEFRLVKNERGMPSVDPNDIGGWTWYHSTNIAVGGSSPSISI